MSVSYFRKSSETTQSLFSLKQGLSAHPGGRDFKMGPERCTAGRSPGDWEVNEQVLEEVGSMEVNLCHLNLI